MKAIMKSWFPEGANANIDLPTDKRVEVCIDNTIPENMTPVPEDTIRFFVTTEPLGDYNKLILQNRHCFTYLLTQFDELLQLPNAGRLIGCGSFVDPNPDIKKKFGVSIIMTSRNCLPGHALRHELYARRKEIHIPFDIYAGTWNEFKGPDTIPMPPWPNKREKVAAMDCMYHICIEGLKCDYHYSEKLIDPLITKTIPIYFGYTRLSEVFNTDAILEVNNVDTIINICNYLESYHYYKLMDQVNENYEKALKLYRYEDILRNAMLKIME